MVPPRVSQIWQVSLYLPVAHALLQVLPNVSIKKSLIEMKLFEWDYSIHFPKNILWHFELFLGLQNITESGIIELEIPLSESEIFFILRS